MLATPKETVLDGIEPIRLVEYGSAVEVMRAFWGFGIEDISDNTNFPSIENSDLLIGANKLLRTITEAGFWGYSKQDDRSIHFWHGGNLSQTNLLAFFAHEIGHLVGECKSDLDAEEDRSNTYAFAAVKAAEFVGLLKNVGT